MKTQPGKFFQMRASEEFTRKLDTLRKREDDLPSRAELMRRLVDRALRMAELKTAYTTFPVDRR